MTIAFIWLDSVAILEDVRYVLNRLGKIPAMTRENGRLSAYQRSERGTLLSPTPPQELLGHIAGAVGRKPSPLDDVLFSVSIDYSKEDYREVKRDWQRRGDIAIRSRGLYGHVDGSRFWLEVATGYDSRRQILPRLVGEVVPGTHAGSKIHYRLRMIQRSRAVAYAVAFAGCLLFVCVGLLIVIGSHELVGVVPIACGVLFAICFHWSLVRGDSFVARLAEHLTSVLVELSS
jgi:hypothetical protein